jgi:Ca2+-binding RTX toxin-like protein
MNGDLRDLGEEICVEHIGGNQAKVWSERMGVDYSAAQIYAVDPNQGIFVYGGEGNDVIFVKGNIKVTAEGGTGDDMIVADSDNKSAYIHGNLGNDTLVGEDGDDQIWGDEGDDTIHGRGGKDWLFGDSADITLGPTGSLRVATSSKDGNDIVWGGGNDIIYGETGLDVLSGGADNHEIQGGLGKTQSSVTVLAPPIPITTVVRSPLTVKTCCLATTATT